MKKLWIVSAVVPLVMALALVAATAVAQGGVTVFTGFVTLNGAPAPAGTTVNVTLATTGAVLGTGTTGGAGFAVNQYRIDIQATGALENQTVNLTIPGTSQAVQATAVFNANFVRTVNIVATTGSVTVFTGFVTINGAPAPAGTTVNVTLQTTGAVIGTGTTGGAGLAVNLYRIEIQATSALEGQTVNLVVPGTSQATQATAVFNANVVRTVDIVATAGIAAATALAPLINTGHLIIVTSFNYATALSEAFVPNLPGNRLTEIRPHSVLIITLGLAHTVVISGNSFPIRANTPTPVPVEGIVTITLQ